MCYTYDSLNRVTKRRIYSLSNNSLISEEDYSYDAAGNITDAPDNCFSYDTNNRLVVFDGNSVSYDLDGNMLSNGIQSFTYDSANRLITAGGHAYIYNAEDVRIRNVCDDAYTTYVYDTNCRLSQLLTKTTDGVVTKYVYGLGLIGEETSNSFKTYHFDFRGSTVAITNANGQVTDTFKYDTYGNVIERTGSTAVIFTYNGRDGVVTDANGLIYMRARYYSPEMKRFVNADIIAGEISNAVTLNRYAYANGNPVSNIDPFGLSPDEGRGGPTVNEATYMAEHIYTMFYDKPTKLIGGWKFDHFLYNAGETGLRIGVYKRENEDGTIDYTVVNRGTTDWSLKKSDVYNNILQPLGLSLDMHISINLAELFVKSHPGADITFVGHSKGGGEALANALATNKDAIVFNPAIPNYIAYGLPGEKYTATALSFVVTGEVLSTAYLGAETIASSPLTPLTLNPVDDTIHLLSRPVFMSPPFWVTIPLPSQSSDPIENHGMEKVKSALNEKAIYKNIVI